MDENEYHRQCDILFSRMENMLDDAGVDFDSNGNMVEVELDDGGKIVINRQPAVREVWLASVSGGYHFKWQNEQWQNTRGQGEIISMLTQLIEC